MKEKITKEITTKIGSEIIAKIAAFTKDIWRVEFEALTNIKIPQSAIDSMVLEGIYFSIYYLQSRSKGIFDDEEKKQFINGLKNYIIWALSEVYFEPLFEKTETEKHKKNVEGLFNEYFDKRMKAYLEFKGGNIAQLYKGYILFIFNDNDLKIKFAENKFMNRIKLELARILGGPNADFAKDIISDVKIIDCYVKSIVDSLFEINIQKIVMDER